MPRGKVDAELASYREQIGSDRYDRLYRRYYQEARQKKSRFSGLDYENSAEKLRQIKDKYKDGVTEKILSELFK